jgi:hypothetical protein
MGVEVSGMMISVAVTVGVAEGWRATAEAIRVGVVAREASK